MTLEKMMEAGDVRGAIAQVEKDFALGPRDPGMVFMLFELKAIVEDFDGSFAALDELAQAAPQMKPMLDDMRLCVQADQERSARRRTAKAAGNRRAVAAPAPFQLAGVKAATLFAEGDHKGAAAAIAEMNTLRPAQRGTLHFHRGTPKAFEDITDSDELIGGMLEVVGPPGTVDVSFQQLKSVVFHEVRGFQDTLWLPATLQLRDGRTLPVRIPSLYTGSGTHDIPQIRMGSLTMWDREPGFAIGYGQRDFALKTGDGQTLVGIRQVSRIDFDSDAPASSNKPGFFKKLFG